MIQNTKVKVALIGLAFALVMFVWPVFSGRLILPQTFSLGPITIRYYGIMMALAVASGWKLAEKRMNRFGIEGAAAQDVLFRIIVGGFIGARLYHVLSSFDYYRDHIIEILKVWQGGLSIYGAVLGGLITLLLCKRILNFLNLLTPSIILGQIIGRLGNLFNYEAFGYPTNLPWKMFVPESFRPFDYQAFGFFHPWFLYEQIGLIIIFFIIQKLESRGSGYLFIYYLLLYNILRFGLEILRVDSTFIGQFRLNSIVSFILIIITVIILRSRKDAQLS